jgi:Domain of unknown function (DUF1910)
LKRDVLFDADWHDRWVAYEVSAIVRFEEERRQPSGNAQFRPQFVYELAGKHLHLLLRRYSRGDAIAELRSHIPPLLDAWEEAERLGATVWSEELQFSRHAWTINLDFYIDCFWLTGLALALNIPDDDWRRLMHLMGNEGQDALLDRVIASRQPGRKIGSALCHPSRISGCSTLYRRRPSGAPNCCASSSHIGTANSTGRRKRGCRG